jgi:hypothetical protein
VILDFLLSAYDDVPFIGVYESTEGLSLGDWRAIHRFSDAYWLRAVTESLRSEIEVIENFWMAPLRHYSVTVGAVGVMGPEYYGPGPVLGRDVGEALDELQASDLVVMHNPRDLCFAVRGEDVMPLGDHTAEVIGGTHSLSELQDIFFARYEPLRQAARLTGEWVLGSGAPSSGPDVSQSPRDAPTTALDASGESSAGPGRRALVGGVVLLVGLAALLVGWRRRPRDKKAAA